MKLDIYTVFFLIAILCPTFGSIFGRILAAPKKGQSDGQVTSQILGVLSLLAFFTSVIALPMP